jgi:nitroreductase
VELTDVIKERRSIRKFKGDDVSSSDLEEIMEAIRWAPSWKNTQCWEVVVVKDGDRKTKLAETLTDGNPAKRAITQAPVVLAMCARKGISGLDKGEMATNKGDWFMFDTGLAVQNLCLKAHNLGLGTVIVGLFDANGAERVLGVPGDRSVVVLVPLGIPEKISRAPDRKEIAEFVRYETY